MVKTGLFLCSIGLLLIVFNANQNTGVYNWLNIIMGLTLLAIGVIVYLKGAKAEKTENSKNKEVK